jgi:TonB family protein
MKNSAINFFFFIISFLINSNFGISQKMEDFSDVKIVDSIYTILDEEAEFPGGTVALVKFIQENLIYPEGYSDIDVIGKIYVKFVVSKTGLCTDFQILRGIKDPKLERTVIDMLKKMPSWKPAKIDGKDVDSYYLIPVHIDYE